MSDALGNLLHLFAAVVNCACVLNAGFRSYQALGRFARRKEAGGGGGITGRADRNTGRLPTLLRPPGTSDSDGDGDHDLVAEGLGKWKVEGGKWKVEGGKWKRRI